MAGWTVVILLVLVAASVPVDAVLGVLTLSLGGMNAVPSNIPGVKTDWHNLSHHGKDETKIDELKLIEAAEFKEFSRFLGQLKAVDEHGRSLLDNTAVLFGSNLGNASSHSLQVLHETYPPGADTGEKMLSHQAEEAGVVIAGIIEITVGDQVRVLNRGDGYLFDSRLPHKFRNIGDQDCVIISACTPPTF